MLLTEQQVLLSVIFPLEAKESLVPEESEERFAGGVLFQTSMQIQLLLPCRADVNWGEYMSMSWGRVTGTEKQRWTELVSILICSVFIFFSRDAMCGCCIRNDELRWTFDLPCMNLLHRHNNFCWWIGGTVAVKLLILRSKKSVFSSQCAWCCLAVTLYLVAG